MKDFKGEYSILLHEYLDLKLELGKLKLIQRFEPLNKEVDKIKNIEERIVEIIEKFDQNQLKKMIYMSLDIDYYKLVSEGRIGSKGE